MFVPKERGTYHPTFTVESLKCCTSDLTSCVERGEQSSYSESLHVNPETYNMYMYIQTKTYWLLCASRVLYAIVFYRDNSW